MSIEDKIRKFIVTNLYFSETSTLADDVSFLAEGVIDSMGSMELVAFVESEFGIKVDMSEVVVKNFDSIIKLANFVRRKLSLPNQSSPRPLPDMAELPLRTTAAVTAPPSALPEAQ